MPEVIATASQTIDSVRSMNNPKVGAQKLREQTQGIEVNPARRTLCAGLGCGACGGVIDFHHHESAGQTDAKFPEECADPAVRGKRVKFVNVTPGQ